MTDTTYYRVDSTKISYQEVWRFARGPMRLAILLVVKLFRIPLKSTAYHARPAPILILDADMISPTMAEALHGLRAELERHRFRFQFFYTVPSIGPTTGVAAALMSDDSRSLALLSGVESSGHLKLRRRTACILHSRCADGTFVSTGNGPNLLQAPPEFKGLNLSGRPIVEVVTRHRERISGFRVIPLPSDAPRVQELVGDLACRIFDYQVRRGVFVPLTPAEGRAILGRDQGLS